MPFGAWNEIQIQKKSWDTIFAGGAFEKTVILNEVKKLSLFVGSGGAELR